MNVPFLIVMKQKIDTLLSFLSLITLKYYHSTSTPLIKIREIVKYEYGYNILPPI